LISTVTNDPEEALADEGQTTVLESSTITQFRLPGTVGVSPQPDPADVIITLGQVDIWDRVHLILPQGGAGIPSQSHAPCRAIQKRCACVVTSSPGGCSFNISSRGFLACGLRHICSEPSLKSSGFAFKCFHNVEDVNFS